MSNIHCAKQDESGNRVGSPILSEQELPSLRFSAHRTGPTQRGRQPCYKRFRGSRPLCDRGTGPVQGASGGPRNADLLGFAKRVVRGMPDGGDDGARSSTVYGPAAAVSELRVGEEVGSRRPARPEPSAPPSDPTSATPPSVPESRSEALEKSKAAKHE